jgi:hypothetical protein
MKKEIKEIVLVNGEKVFRITTEDERFYGKSITNQETGVPEIEWLPSVSWLVSFYPKGIEFYKWLAERGWDEAESIKKEAGNSGDKIHQASEIIDIKGSIMATDKFMNKERGELEELGYDELEAIKSYQEWVDDVKPQVLANEMTVFGKNEITGWAGTLDRIYRIDGQIWIVDLKSSNSIWPSYKVQVSAYSGAEIDYKMMGITDEEWQVRKLAILRLGYKYNKIKKYKFDEVEDLNDLFLATCKIWKQENPDSKPKQKDFPLEIKSVWRTSQLEPAVIPELEPIKKPITKIKTIKK